MGLCMTRIPIFPTVALCPQDRRPPVIIRLQFRRCGIHFIPNPTSSGLVQDVGHTFAVSKINSSLYRCNGGGQTREVVEALHGPRGEASVVGLLSRSANRFRSILVVSLNIVNQVDVREGD